MSQNFYNCLLILDQRQNHSQIHNHCYHFPNWYWSNCCWKSDKPSFRSSPVPLFDIGDRLIAIFFFLTGILVWILLLTYSLRLSRKFASDKILKFIIKGSAYLIIAFAILITYETIAFIFNFPSLR